MPHVHPTVLLIDDNDDVREVLTDLIHWHGYAIEAVSNGREALAKLATLRPCIIVLDLNMPEMPGDQFRMAQLEHPEWREIPVIVLSAAHDVAQQATRLGAAGYAGKPVTIAELMALIREHCLP